MGLVSTNLRRSVFAGRTLFPSHLTKSIVTKSVDQTMNELEKAKDKRPEPLDNCYGCDHFHFDITKPLLDGDCSYFKKRVRLAVTKQGLYHMQLQECLELYDD